jgi:restriction system protein
MALWLVRAGSYGEHEKQFFENDKIYLTWRRLEHTPLNPSVHWDALKDLLRGTFPEFSERRIGMGASQIFAFVSTMKVGDWIALPQKTAPAIAFGEIIGNYEYKYDPKDEGLYSHSRRVKWLNKEVPRSVIDQDILDSLGSLLTICRIERNDAEARIHQLASRNWLSGGPSVLRIHAPTNADEVPDRIDIEQIAQDAIAKRIKAKFTNHRMARLVEAVLQAQGYTTYRSPEGPDGGVDILASAGPIGFGQPRICVQVKSGDSPTDTPTVNQLIGSMQNVHAEQGLFVSWAGYKQNLRRDFVPQFFRVRLWDSKDLIREIFENYDKLAEDVRADLPLKRIWTVVEQEDEE